MAPARGPSTRRWLRPVPASWARAGSAVALVAWAAQMAVLVDRSYLQASSMNLAADLARYGGAAQWRGVYYRGDKIGFTVGETVPVDGGFELREDGRLQMALLGATTAARVRTLVRVDQQFTLRSFEFSLDPGTGAVQVGGTVDGMRLDLTITTPAGTRSESRELQETPALSLSVPRRLAAAGLRAGAHHELTMFDPATLRNAPLVVDVQAREVVSAAGRPVPAFRVRSQFGGITSFSWVTDTGEVVKEESPLGLVVVRETQERAVELAVSGEIRRDMLAAAAVVPTPPVRIDDTGAVERLNVVLKAEGLDPAELDGVGQTVSIRSDSYSIEIRDLQNAAPGAPDPDSARFLGPEAFVESDAPEIVAEARAALAGATRPREQAERLVRHVAELLEKKPTVSLPSALEVLRTRVGDCNEHTVLYVALARASGLPARVAVGVVYMRGAFYYHAWPEVYVEEQRRGQWLPVDPTLNQFPADATHVRLARGGLDRQAVVLPLIGRMAMSGVRVDLKPGSVPVLVGGGGPKTPTLAGPGFPAAPVRRDCWSDFWGGP